MGNDPAWGTYNVTLSVNDSSGTNVSVTKSILAPPPSGCPIPVNPLNSPALVALLVVIGLAVGIPSAIVLLEVYRLRNEGRRRP